MKLPVICLGVGVLASCANADYFSAGWSPGQPVSTSDTPAPTYTPTTHTGAEKKPQGGLVERFLSSGPLASLFQRAGVNISEKLEAALSKSIWDERIPLITDNNYGELIVNESLSEEEEQKRVWFIIVTVTAAKQDGVSKILDDVFDSAFNQSQVTEEIPHVRWGRIDYLNVTAITTRWAVWHAPLLVVLRDRGQELRFYRPYQLNLRAEAMLEFLKQDGWKSTPPWSSPYAPGGNREYLMEYLAIVLTKIYNVTVLIPNWILLILSGGLASLLIKLLHRNPAPSPTAPRRQPVASASKPTDAVTVTPTSPSTSQASQGSKRSGIKQRKAGKK